MGRPGSFRGPQFMGYTIPACSMRDAEGAVIEVGEAAGILSMLED